MISAVTAKLTRDEIRRFIASLAILVSGMIGGAAITVATGASSRPAILTPCVLEQDDPLDTAAPICPPRGTSRMSPVIVRTSTGLKLAWYDVERRRWVDAADDKGRRSPGTVWSWRSIEESQPVE